MFINAFQAHWQSILAARNAALTNGTQTILLIDSAFVPGLFRQLDVSCNPVLLFETLPGCSDETRDVSPFLVHFDQQDPKLACLLAQCDGWPMISAIFTNESIERLGERLAAWCIVEVDHQRFNFRFPDTRRLPFIFETMTPQQRREFVGNSSGWHYIGRDGSWQVLPLEVHSIPAAISDRPALSERQFVRLVKDSEPDEIWMQLRYRGVQSLLQPFERHVVLSNALTAANAEEFDDLLKIQWCSYCIEKSLEVGAAAVSGRLAQWKREKFGSENEVLHRTA